MTTPSSAGLFKIRTLKAARIGGRRLLAGSTFESDPFTAVELVRAGEAVLVSDADLPRLLAILGARRPR